MTGSLVSQSLPHSCTLQSGGHTVSSQQTLNGSLCDLTMHRISCWFRVTCSKVCEQGWEWRLVSLSPSSCSGLWHCYPHWGSTSKSQTSGISCDMRKAALILPEEPVSFCPFELQTEETEGNLCNTQLWAISECPSRAHHGSLYFWVAILHTGTLQGGSGLCKLQCFLLLFCSSMSYINFLLA